MLEHELLSPAGSPEIFREVIAAGADAVYIGGDKFGARAFAKNFAENDVLEAIDHAHLRDRKVFLTVNTLLKNIEIQRELYDYILPFYKHGLDAIIVQDYGVFQFIRKYFPELPIHCSTQMSVSNHYGAELLKAQGASRVVTARELSLDEIRNIYDHTHMEIESFVHGALCYCYSGQCLMSSLIGGRSGNRGRCAQPCRLPYQVKRENGKVIHPNENYPLSPKDLCTIELLPEICASGVYSFKIEGRMKQLEYAAGVTEIYRHYIDLYENDPIHYQVEKNDIDRLLQLGNRNGFTKGYYVMHNGPSMITRTESSHNSEDRSRVYTRKQIAKIPVYASAYLEPGMESSLTLISEEHPEIAVSVSGGMVSEAIKRPMTDSDISKQISKTGDTPFEMTNCEVIVNGNCFVPNKQLNELRREALSQLSDALLAGTRRLNVVPYEGHPTLSEMDVLRKHHGENPIEEKFLHVVVSDEKQLDKALTYPWVSMISLDFHDKLDDHRCRIQKAGKKAGYFMPHVFRFDTAERMNKSHFADILTKFDRIWARSYDSLGYLCELSDLHPNQIAIDYGLYAFSDHAVSHFAQLLGNDFLYTISFELNRKELLHLDTSSGEMVLYGHQPLMVSAQCVYKNYDACMKGKENVHTLHLEDRIHNNFLINRKCEDCYNVIYNHCPLSLLHLTREMDGMKMHSYRLHFTMESVKEMEQVMTYYKQFVIDGKPMEKNYMKYTTGHFHRGVD